MAKCRYMLCDREAKGLVRMSVLTPADAIGKREIPMCQYDSDRVAMWLVEGYIPHITDLGELYVGDLDELAKRK